MSTKYGLKGHNVARGKLRVYVSTEKLRLAKRAFRRNGVFYIEGGASISVQSLQMKYLQFTACKEWPDIWGEVYPMTPGEAAYSELKRAYPNLTRTGWRKGHLALLKIPMPMYCLERWSGKGAYVDLVSAYWQIYRNLWIDTKYPRGQGTLPMRPVADRLEKWKAARNAVIGIVRSSQLTGVSEGRRVKLYARNPFLNPLLWATIQETLHGLARIAMSCGAIYCMTDGYLFADQQGCKVFLDYLDELEAPYRVMWGRIDVRGWMSYSAPHKTTVMYRAGSEGGVGFKKLSDKFKDPFLFPEWVYKDCRKAVERAENV